MKSDIQPSIQTLSNAIAFASYVEKPPVPSVESAWFAAVTASMPQSQ